MTVLTGSGDGTIRLDVLDDDTIIDAATNPLDGGFTTGEAYSVDRTNPDTIITFPVASGTYNDSAFDGGCSTAGGDICGTATDPVTGGVASGVASVKVVVRQNSSGNYWDGSSFSSTTAVLLPATGTTTWSLAFPATNFPDEGDYTIVSIATDAVGNAHMLANSFTVDLQHRPHQPDVTIDQAAGQADPTNASPIHFTAVFSEPVSGFDGSDVDLSGSAGATTAVVTEIAPNDGTTYDVAVSGMTSDGDVTVAVPAGGATDAATNTNDASTSTDATVTYDTTAPVVDSVVRADADPTNASSIDFTVTFSEDRHWRRRQRLRPDHDGLHHAAPRSTPSWTRATRTP